MIEVDWMKTNGIKQEQKFNLTIPSDIKKLQKHLRKIKNNFM